jgi:hypothetical protein
MRNVNSESERSEEYVKNILHKIESGEHSGEDNTKQIDN